MSDDTTAAAQLEINEVDQLKQELAEARKSIESLVAKKEELLNETKAAKEEKRIQKEQAEQAKKEKLDAAEKNGEFEHLYKSALEEKEKYKAELTNYQIKLKQHSVDVKAERIALDLSKDPIKAEPLKDLLTISLMKLADETGHIDEDVLKSFKNQIETDKKYAIFMASNQAVGGGAPGNIKSSASDTNKHMSPIDRINHMRANKN